MMNNYDDKDYMTVGNLITHLQKMIVEGKTTFESPVLWFADEFGSYGTYQKPEKCKEFDAKVKQFDPSNAFFSIQCRINHCQKCLEKNPENKEAAEKWKNEITEAEMTKAKYLTYQKEKAVVLGDI